MCKLSSLRKLTHCIKYLLWFAYNLSEIYRVATKNVSHLQRKKEGNICEILELKATVLTDRHVKLCEQLLAQDN